MKIKLFSVFSIFVLLTSCEVVNEINLQSKTQTNIQSESFPFHYVKKLIVVDAYLNQSNKANRFIFDTGAFQSKIEYNLAQELGLETFSKRDNGTAQGIKREIEITTLDSIKFSKSMFGNIAAGKLKYDAKSYSPCVAEDGIIGSNLIKLAYWKFDFEKQRIHISKEAFSPKADHLTYIDYSTSFMSGVPLIDLEIQGETIQDVIFDLGYNGGLVIPKKYSSRFQSQKTQLFIDQSTSGIFGSNLDTLLVKDLDVKINDLKMNIPVEFSSLNKSLIGNDILEHFTIYLNPEDHQIILQPISKVEVDQNKKFIPGILNDLLWIVNRTTAEIPLQIGDTLVSINSFQPKDLFETHCDYFLQLNLLLNQDTLSIEDKQGRILKIQAY
jgi:predicted aspartyl protease